MAAEKAKEAHGRGARAGAELPGHTQLMGTGPHPWFWGHWSPWPSEPLSQWPPAQAASSPYCSVVSEHHHPLHVL